MSDGDWLTLTDPETMFSYVTKNNPSLQMAGGWMTTERKLFLFSAAVIRHRWGNFSNEEIRRSMEITERKIEDEASDVEAYVAYVKAQTERTKKQELLTGAAWAVEWLIHNLRKKIDTVHDAIRIARAYEAVRGAISHDYPPLAELAPIFRDIVGNPFDPFRLPSECPWLTPTVTTLAEAAYQERMPDGKLDSITLFALADALEEAGCDGDHGEQILWHLRGIEPCPWCLIGSHGMEEACGGNRYGKYKSGKFHGLMKKRSACYRGCHVIDLLTRRK